LLHGVSVIRESKKSVVWYFKIFWSSS